jgi:maltooligosyltrehalose synthase
VHPFSKTPPLRSEIWGDTAVAAPALREFAMRDVFTGNSHRPQETLLLAELLADFPVAVLVSQSRG